MKIESSKSASFEAHQTGKSSESKKDVSNPTPVNPATEKAGKDSKVNESATTHSYRAFALQKQFNAAATTSSNAPTTATSSASRSQVAPPPDANRKTADQPPPQTFTSAGGQPIPAGQAWVIAPGTVVAELAAQDLKNSAGPQAYQQFIQHLEQHQNDADWLQRFYSTLGTKDTARLMSEVPASWVTDSQSKAYVIGNSLNTLAANGKLNQSDLDTLLLNTALSNSDLGVPSLFNGLASGVFAKLPDTASGTALKEMFFNSATKLAFGELRSSDQSFNARLDSFKNNYAAAATEVLATRSPATQLKTLNALNSSGRLTDFIRLATQGYQPPGNTDGINSFGKLDQLLNTVANYNQTAARQAGVNLSDIGVKMYNAVLLGMMESGGQAASNLSGNTMFRQAVSQIFIREQRQLAAKYPQTEINDIVEILGNKFLKGDKAYDGLYLGANNKLYVPGTPFAAIPGVRPSNGQATVGKTFYVNGMQTDTATQAASLQAIANTTGMEVVGIRNSTEGKRPDLAQSIGDKADIGVNPAVDTLASAVYDEIKAGRTVHLIAHSQGGIITSRALRDVYGRLEADGLTKAQVEEKLGKVEVETFAAAAWTYPDGPQYVHYINNYDGVPLAAGGAQTGNERTNLLKNFYPGRGAVVHRFAENRGGRVGEFIGKNHDLDNLYLGWRVPFRQAQSPEFRAVLEILDRSNDGRISDMRRDLNLTPQQIRNLAVAYPNSLLQGEGNLGNFIKDVGSFEDLKNLSKKFDLSNTQIEELLMVVGKGSASPDADMFDFLNLLGNSKLHNSDGGAELTPKEYKQALKDLIKLQGEYYPGSQATIQSYQRVFDYLDKLP